MKERTINTASVLVPITNQALYERAQRELAYRTAKVLGVRYDFSTRLAAMTPERPRRFVSRITETLVYQRTGCDYQERMTFVDYGRSDRPGGWLSSCFVTPAPAGGVSKARLLEQHVAALKGLESALTSRLLELGIGPESHDGVIAVLTSSARASVESR